MKFLKNTALFCAGGGAYVGLELLFRGRSHSSMFAAGGLSLLLIGRLEQRHPELPAGARHLLGAGIITAVELATGLLVNRDYRVWDYRKVPGNFRGQICPLLTLLWIPAAAAAGWLYKTLNRVLP